MNRTSTLLLAALLPAVCLCQARDGAVDAPPPPPVSNLEGGWDHHIANAQAAQWKDVNIDQPDNAKYQLNWLRSEYNARYGNNNGELTPADNLALDQIAAQIKAGAAGSFEAHMAGFYTEFPAAEAFTELEAAYRMAPDRRELAAPMLSKAMLQGDQASLKHWSGEMLRNESISAPLYAAASDMLLSIPSNAILFTNGDMDTQPAVVEQVQQHKKPGALLVDRRLLANGAYRNRVWTEAGGKGAAPANGPGFAKALLGTSRPVYFALSLDRNWLEAFAGQLHAVGAAFRVGSPLPDDASHLARNWAAMQKPLNAGPMSRNYLLPGSILLAQYQTQGASAKATALKTELHQIAKATGGLDDLINLNVISH